MTGTTPIRFDGRAAIVTGAGRGLGRAHALLLAGRGAAVLVNDTGASLDGTGGSSEPAEQVADEIIAAGGTAVADSHTAATPEGGEAIVASALEAFGRVDIVVNNAGIIRDKSFPNMSPERFRPVVDVHLHGAVNVTRAAWPTLRAQRFGRIINTTSASGLYGGFGQSNYGAAKMAVIGLTRALAVEGRDRGIKVNAVAPLAQTRMTDGVFGRYAAVFDPALVSPVVAWLASDDCPVTGQIYTAGGGRVASVFIAETGGFQTTDLTPEAVRDHLAEIQEQAGYSVPENVTASIRLALRYVAPNERAAAPPG